MIEEKTYWYENPQNLVDLANWMSPMAHYNLSDVVQMLRYPKDWAEAWDEFQGDVRMRRPRVHGAEIGEPK